MTRWRGAAQGTAGHPRASRAATTTPTTNATNRGLCAARLLTTATPPPGRTANGVSADAKWLRGVLTNIARIITNRARSSGEELDHSCTPLYLKEHINPIIDRCSASSPSPRSSNPADALCREGCAKEVE